MTDLAAVVRNAEAASSSLAPSTNKSLFQSSTAVCLERHVVTGDAYGMHRQGFGTGSVTRRSRLPAIQVPVDDLADHLRHGQLQSGFSQVGPKPVNLARTVGILAVVAGGCGAENPTSPDRRQPLLVQYCQTNGVNVVCTAMIFDVPTSGAKQDVTRVADWSVLPADVAKFSAPGTMTPLRVGEAQIQLRYAEWNSYTESAFLVGPNQDARWLYFLLLQVRETDNQTPIAGANVQILDGYRTGAVCTTNSFGSCRIDRLLTGETFNALVSKNGYRATTFSYRVDPPVGLGNSPFFAITLSRDGA